MRKLLLLMWQHLLAVVILTVTIAQMTIAAPPNFTRITTGPHVNDGGSSYGVSWIDIDNDGYLDIYVGNAGVENNFLYHSEGDGAFTKVTTDPIANDSSRSYSHAWGDYDNDGDEDVYVSRHNNNPNYFYTNNSEGTFTKIDTAGDLTTDPACSNTHAWIDIDNDGDLDLYSQTESLNLPWSDANAMYRNDDGIFVKITTGEIVTDINNAHGMCWSDYDNDGDMDLFVANAYFDYPQQDPEDYMYKNCYYRNDGDFNFTKIVSGPVANDLSISFAPSVGDYDNDGDQDLFVGNGAMELVNFLYNNNGDGSFTRITTGEMVTNATSTLGSSWVDYDNDGDLDMYVTTWEDSLSNQLYENIGDGTFTRIMTGPLVNDESSNFGPAWGDYDRDGDLDVFISKYQNDNRLYRNDGNGNNWLNVKCTGTFSNATAIGTKVRLKANIFGNPVWQLREITPAASYCIHHALNAHFGLGDADIVDSIIVQWPSGLEETILNVSINQYLTITEGDFTPVLDDEVNPLPDRYNLSMNYPNPFNSSTTIEFDLPRPSKATVTVYNLLGQEVETLVDEQMLAGNHSVNWEASNYSSGNYFYKLTAGENVFTKRMTLLK
ncbi:MAG: T9SS type A sorting domain-containing protein [candidate division Zixibacteria bacterium]|nr:T9SS type A sorting domain-containing protein [candidate division Zixibacteria bacterium]